MLINVKRHSWGVLNNYSSEASSSYCSEGSDYQSEYAPLLSARRHSESEIKRATEEDKQYGYFQGLCVNYGPRFIFCLVVYQHVMKGFVYQICAMGNPYLYKAYNVPAPLMQMFMSVTDLPWALKPVIGLVSDVFPIFGYNKTPYIVVTSMIGTACFFCVGLLPHTKLPLLLMVVFMFFASLQLVTADVLLQGSFSSKVRTSLTRSRGLDLLTFAWSGVDAGGVAGVIVAGLVLMNKEARNIYIISAAFALVSVYPAARGYLDEKWVAPAATQRIRMWFWGQKEACFLAVVMFFMTILIPIVTLVYESTKVSGIVCLCILFLMVIASLLVLTPMIAMTNAFSMIVSSFHINITAATFYFFTDNGREFPNGPQFSDFFYNAVMGCVSFVGFIVGIYTYQRLSQGWTYRNWFIMSNLVFSLTNVLYILLYKRIEFGIPEWLFTLISLFVNTITERWKLMPLYCLMTYLCPKGMESTAFGCLVGSNNIAVAISFQFGGWFLYMLGCQPAGLVNESSEFAYLWIAATWNSVVPFTLVLLFHRLVPNAYQNKALLKRNATFTEGSALKRFMKWMYPPPEHRAPESSGGV